VLPLKFLCLTLPIPNERWWDPDPLLITDHGIALSFAITIPTLKYIQIARNQQEQVVGKTCWRIHPRKAGQIGIGQEVSGEKSERVTKIADEDGLNARGYFDWEWRFDF
jgi:hypothetical protein